MSIKTRIIAKSEIDVVVSLCCEVQNIHVSFAPAIYRTIQKPELKKWFEEHLEEQGTSIIVASKDDVDVGYLLLKLVEREEHLFHFARRFAEVDQICVTENLRNSGIGKALVSAAKEIAIKAGIYHLELNVLAFNVEAKKAFEKLGFSTKAERMLLQC